MLQPKTAADITERIVAIVRFGPSVDGDGNSGGQFYQVTVDPSRFSPDGLYIRFGSYPGDEIMGWQKADCIYVLSHLATWPQEDTEPTLTWYESPALEHKA